jgi:hypothetical protein
MYVKVVRWSAWPALWRPGRYPELNLSAAARSMPGKSLSGITTALVPVAIVPHRMSNRAPTAVASLTIPQQCVPVIKFVMGIAK